MFQLCALPIAVADTIKNVKNENEQQKLESKN